MGRLAGKTAFVSGAASGIGLASALLLAQEGASVIVADRAEDRLAEAALQFPARDQVDPIVMDVTSEADWQRAANRVDERFGRLDILAYIAGFGTFR